LPLQSCTNSRVQRTSQVLRILKWSFAVLRMLSVNFISWYIYTAIYCDGRWYRPLLPNLTHDRLDPLDIQPQSSVTVTNPIQSKSHQVRGNSGGNVSREQVKFLCREWPKVPDALEMCRTTLTELSRSNGTAPHPISDSNLAQHQQNRQNQMKDCSERVHDFQWSTAPYGPRQRPSVEDKLNRWADKWKKMEKQK
jgi:hypothetical protein